MSTNIGRISVSGSDFFAANKLYAHPLISPNIDNMVLESMSIYVAGGSVRLALFSGGSSNTDPTGAVLIEDFGLISHPSGTWGWETVASATNPGLPKNTRHWLCMKLNATSKRESNSANKGDFLGSVVTVAGTTNGETPASAYSTPMNGSMAPNPLWHNLYLTYGIASSTAAHPLVNTSGNIGPSLVNGGLVSV